MRLLQTGDPGGASTILDALVAQHPRNARLLVLLAKSQLLLVQIDSAVAIAQRAIKADPKLPDAHCQLGDIERKAQRLDAANEAYHVALALDPDSPWALKGVAEVCFLTSNTEEAERILIPAIERQPANPMVSLAFARVCKKIQRVEQGIGSLNRWVGNDSVDQASRREGLFLLGALLDSMKQYDDAWNAYQRGNALRIGSFDPARHAKAIESRINAVNNPLSPDALPRSTVESSLPVLIVGMPRSGTSLVEQIIDTHPDAHGSGELTDLARIEGDLNAELQATLNPRPLVELSNEAADTYIGVLRTHSADADRVTDKNPFNFERLGMIDRVLPGAKIIHCMRNPIDTCLSCYFSSFPGETTFTNDPEHTALYFNQYRRLMEHWKQAVAVPILDVSYESMTSEPEKQIRAMIGFLGLPWDDACLKHHESGRVTHTSSAGQVDKPIYRSSVERWRNYEKHLGPMIAALDDA